MGKRKWYDMREFLAFLESNKDVMHIREQVDPGWEINGITRVGLQEGGPTIVFHNIKGADYPLVTNMLGADRRYLWALGIDKWSDFNAEWIRRTEKMVPWRVVKDAPCQEQVIKGRDIDLHRICNVIWHQHDGGEFPGTLSVSVTRDPDTGVETEGYHRFQVKARHRMGVSLHSRRRMFEYQRRAEARGKALPCAIVLGLHPLVSMGSLAYPPADVGKFEVVGGLFGEPLEVAPCATLDLSVPAAAEIVIEGEILAGAREPEGPFGEFTGYFSRRSTEHVFQATALAMRERPWFQSIGSGRAGDHITTLGLVREAEILNALTRAIPNVTGVHVPLSGTASFTAYVALGQSRPGEAKHAIAIALGVDHYLKLVVVVDDDIDVFDESDVLWAVATRMQADRDLVVIPGSLGAMLDPSADERGVTAKLGIDATRPFGQPFAEKLVMPPDRMAWACALVDRLGR